MSPATRSLQRHLEALIALREAKGVPRARLAALKDWQARRLDQTYADMTRQPRYAAAMRFFLEDLYGQKDFTERDDDMTRILPMLSKILPESAVETAALAMELEVLTEELDHRVASALPARGAITEESYAAAYREATTRAQRRKQVALGVAVGKRLDSLVRKPFFLRTLKLMRTPARVAGLGKLQDFLERGFAAFDAIGGADEFLAALEAREHAVIDDLFSGGKKART
jgi:hypothetical protein